MEDRGQHLKYAVVILTDGFGKVGYIGVRRLDQPPDWAALYRAAGEITTPLGKWLQSIPAPPVERIILGSLGLHLGTARAAAALLGRWWNVPMECKRNGRERPTGRIDSEGRLRRWQSRTHAAADLGVTSWAILKAVRGGRMFDL